MWNEYLGKDHEGNDQWSGPKGKWLGWVTHERAIAAEEFFSLETSAYEIARANPRAYGTKIHYFIDDDRNTACGLTAQWDVYFLVDEYDNDKCKRCLKIENPRWRADG